MTACAGGGHQGWRWLIAFNLATGLAFAHGPRDHSARLTLLEERVEISVTLGSEAAGEFFQRHIPESARPQPVGNGLALPAGGADKFLTLAANGQPLTPAEFRVLTDRLEFLFVASFPRPPAAAWSVDAHYLALADDMPAGLFAVQDEAGRRLGDFVLSPATRRVEFEVPTATTTNSPPNGVLSPVTLPATNSVIVLPAPLTRELNAESTPRNRAWIILIAVALASGGLWWGLRSRR